MKQYKIQNRSQKNSQSCVPLNDRWHFHLGGPRRPTWRPTPPRVAYRRLDDEDWGGRCDKPSNKRPRLESDVSERASPLATETAKPESVATPLWLLHHLPQPGEASVAVPRTPRGQKRGRKGGRGGQMVHWVCRRIIKITRKERYFLRLLC